jgi:hypothetical protein
MRSNSGSGKSNNNLRDPTMKEHQEGKRKGHRTDVERDHAQGTRSSES